MEAALASPQTDWRGIVPTSTRTARDRADRLGGKFALDLVDELFVQVEKVAKELDHEPQVLLPVGKAACGPFRVGEPLA